MLLAAAVGLLAACGEGGLPVQPTDLGSIPVRLNLRAVVSSAGRSMKVVASYARTAAPTTLIPLDSTVIILSGTESRVSVRLNIAPCLADTAREVSPDTPVADRASTCVLYLDVTLLDGGNQPIDRASTAPMAVQPGRETTTPTLSLGSPVGSVVLASRAIVLNAIGRSAQLAPEVRDSRGAVIAGPALAFTSLDPLVASVDAGTGLVTARSVGTTGIIATSRSKADTATVLVRQVPASIRLTAPTAPLGLGESSPVSGVLLDSAGVAIPPATAAVVISVDNPAVASVDAGMLRAVGVGTTTLAAGGGGIGTSTTVVVKALAIELAIGASPTLTAAVGATIVVPIVADMTFARGQNLASLSFDLRWDAGAFDLVSTQNGAFGRSGSFFTNTAGAGSGVISVSMFDVDGFTSGTLTLFSVTLRARSTVVGTPIALTVTAAGDASGSSIPSDKLVVRPLAVTIP